jgi:hypothetical protein
MLMLSNIEVAITLMVQLFYAWRIHVLTRNWVLVAVVVSVSLTAAGKLIRISHFTTPDRLSGFGSVVTWETIVRVPQYARMLEIKVSEELQLHIFESHRNEGHNNCLVNMCSCCRHHDHRHPRTAPVSIPLDLIWIYTHFDVRVRRTLFATIYDA